MCCCCCCCDICVGAIDVAIKVLKKIDKINKNGNIRRFDRSLKNKKKKVTNKESLLVAFVVAVDFPASLNDEGISLFAFVASIVDDVEVVDVGENADVVVEARKVVVAGCKLDTRHFRVFHSRYNYRMLRTELVAAALAVVAVVADVVDCHSQLPPC